MGVVQRTSKLTVESDAKQLRLISTFVHSNRQYRVAHLPVRARE